MKLLKQRPPFSQVWDNSMRSKFLSCPRSWLFGDLLGLKSPGTNVHLHAGKAWAEGLEVTRRCFYELKQSPSESISAGLLALAHVHVTGSVVHERLSPVTTEFSLTFDLTAAKPQELTSADDDSSPPAHADPFAPIGH